jgi:hypothetical protein
VASEVSAGARSECGQGDVGPLETDLTGDRADQAEALQAKYENDSGFLGVVVSREEFRVVVDAGTSTNLRDRLRAAGIAAALSCVDSELVDRAKSAFEKTAFSQGEFSSVAYNVLTDSVDIITTLQPDEVNALLGLDATSGTGGVVRITHAREDSLRRLAGRLSDSEPFWGGAKVQTASAACSTGFYINSTTRGTVMLTAGHCFSNGQTIKNGDNSLTVGVLEGRSLPDPDLAVIDGETYAARSYSANNVGSSKIIHSSANPATAVTYCSMGYVLQRVCSQYSSLTAQFCDAFGCTNSLAFTSRPCSTGALGKAGDSGGGVFREITDGTLGARGTVVAGGEVGPAPNCVRYDHKRQTILNFYNATVVLG